MFKTGDLVYDRRLNMIGMITRAWGKPTISAVTQEELDEAWYDVMLFGDKWCEDGKVRQYLAVHADRILERYNPAYHPDSERT